MTRGNTDRRLPLRFAVALVAFMLTTVSVRAQAPEIIEGEANSDLGQVVFVEDIDGDGKAEVIATAPRYSVGRSGFMGRVMIVRGGMKKDAEERIVNWTGPEGSNFGASAAIGDINGDGHKDLLVGGPGTARFLGTCHVILGGKRGGEFLSGGEAKDCVVTLEGDVPNGQFGTAVALGDIDGDGYADLVVSQPKATVGTTPHAGRVLVFRGRKRWKYERYKLGDGKKKTMRPDLVIVGRENEALGHQLLVTDVDGDGAGDIVIGSPWYMNQAGSVVVVRGGKGSLKKPRTIVLDKDDVDLTVRGNRKGQLGARIAAADLNGDGASEILMAEPRRDDGRTKEAGAIHALQWDPSRKRLDLGRSKESEGLTTLRGMVQHERLGGGLSLGHTGGNKTKDLLVGSPDVGRVVWFTDPKPFGKSTRPAGYRMASGAGEKHFGAAMGAGDLDGSGKKKLVVGAPGSSKVFIYPLK